MEGDLSFHRPPILLSPLTILTIPLLTMVHLTSMSCPPSYNLSLYPSFPHYFPLSRLLHKDNGIFDQKWHFQIQY